MKNILFITLFLSVSFLGANEDPQDVQPRAGRMERREMQFERERMPDFEYEGLCASGANVTYAQLNEDGTYHVRWITAIMVRVQEVR